MDIDIDPVILPPWSINPAEGNGPVPALGDLLATPALRWPDRTAVSDGDRSHTFAELERGARTVAAWLAGQGITAKDRVVVLTEKRAVMPLLAVAVWKCAAVYVPLDATEPTARLRALITRLAPAAVITLDRMNPGIPVGRLLLDGERLAALLSGPATDHTTVAHRPDEAAYIVFASSSTGEPRASKLTWAR